MFEIHTIEAEIALLQEAMEREKDGVVVSIVIEPEERLKRLRELRDQMPDFWVRGAVIVIGESPQGPAVGMTTPYGKVKVLPNGPLETDAQMRRFLAKTKTGLQNWYDQAQAENIPKSEVPAIEGVAVIYMEGKPVSLAQMQRARELPPAPYLYDIGNTPGTWQRLLGEAFAGIELQQGREE